MEANDDASLRDVQRDAFPQGDVPVTGAIGLRRSCHFCRRKLDFIPVPG